MTLTIWNGDSASTKFVALNIVDCAEYTFELTHGDETEGAGTFAATGFEQHTAAGCEPTGNAALALEALSRADYYATGFGGIQLWDGPNPLAIFASE